MIKTCEICENKFETNSSSRIYCYQCSGDSTRSDNTTRKHQKNNIKKKHENPNEKEFKLGSGNRCHGKIIKQKH